MSILPQRIRTMPQSRTFSPIQLTKEGLARESDLNLLEQQFSLNHALYLRQLLDPDLTRMILARVPLGVWASYAHRQIGREFLLDSASVFALLNFAVNTPEFLR